MRKKLPSLWEHEAQFIELIARIKHNGIKIDKPFCEEKVKVGEEILTDLRNKLGFNPSSPLDLSVTLLKKLGFPVVRRTEKGNPSFDKHAMEEYDLLLEATNNSLAKKILEYRGWQKTVSSNYMAYLKLADRNDILHPNYKVHGTKTCRTSCEDPNLQQIPRTSKKSWNRDVKKAFIPREDNYVLVEFDFSQIESRLAAAVAKETELLEAFRSDVDIFDVMARTFPSSSIGSVMASRRKGSIGSPT